MEINECVTCANFGDPKSLDRELGLKNIKNAIRLENLLIRL